jgi:Tfp pilus assembly protein PilN
MSITKLVCAIARVPFLCRAWNRQNKRLEQLMLTSGGAKINQRSLEITKKANDKVGPKQKAHATCMDEMKKQEQLPNFPNRCRFFR